MMGNGAGADGGPRSLGSEREISAVNSARGSGDGRLIEKGRRHGALMRLVQITHNGLLFKSFQRHAWFLEEFL